MTKKQLKALKNYITINGGATVAADGSIALLNSGFMVSLAGYEKKSTIKNLSLKVINQYLKQAECLGGFAGFWVDDDILYIDISKNIINKQQAIAEGLKNKQKAIYNIKENQSLYL